MGCRYSLIFCVLVFFVAAFSQPSEGQTTPFATLDGVILSADAVEVSALSGVTWQEGTERVLLVESPCELRFGHTQLRADKCVLWEQSTASENRTFTIYAENARTAKQQGQQVVFEDPQPQFLQEVTARQLKTSFQLTSQEPQQLPTTFTRAVLFREPSVKQPVQLAQFFQAPPVPSGAPLGAVPPNIVAPTVAAPTAQQVQIRPRSSVPMNLSVVPSADGRERVAVIDSGANILISGVPTLGVVDISADRLVFWTSGDFDQMASGGQSLGDGPAELYMEGNIVFRTGERVIYANSMYYDVRTQQGVILDAELLTGIPNYEGLVRLKADVLRQVGTNRFEAFDAAFTSSRLGLPRYWFQADNLTFEEFSTPVIDPISGAAVVDPTTGQPVVDQRRLAQARNNYVFLGGVPVFYWPFASTDLTEPQTYLRRVRFGRDSVFGTQVGLGFDLGRLFSRGQRVQGVDWTGTVDYLSQRGWGFGSSVEYTLPQFFSVPGPTQGFFDGWFIDDQGLDNLGADRRAIPPEEDLRGRAFWQHRQRLANGLQITGELGYISDRNFLEQYYEHEWDEWKDQATGIELKWLGGNSSWNLATDVRINDFFTQTQWFPRLDQFQLGQSLFQDRATWFGHSQLGYAKLEAADPPLDASELAKFNPLPWEADREGIRVGGRHELDFPFQVGAAKVVPYVLGEVMHWGEDLNGNDATRLYGQAGIRASLPMWSVDPNVRSVLWNLNGLSHKVVFESEFLWADANKNLDELPLYDPLDDDSIEHFRRRLVDDQFGGLPLVDDVVPLPFDERFFALRYGSQSWVTGPTEIADDLMLLRLGARQRWQTKRGAPGQQRIVDWMTLDTGLTIFPEDDRDNFGETVGMINYDWRWHLGDRLTLMSDGYADTFNDGLRIFTVGGYLSRPERGSLFAGFRSIEGPISSNLVHLGLNYRLSPKWVTTIGSVVDLGPAGNIGQRFELTRIGESFLVSVGANIDRSRDNVGFSFAIEPRFLRLTRRGFVGGVPIPPAGARGLE